MSGNEELIGVISLQFPCPSIFTHPSPRSSGTASGSVLVYPVESWVTAACQHVVVCLHSKHKPGENLGRFSQDQKLWKEEKLQSKSAVSFTAGPCKTLIPFPPFVSVPQHSHVLHSRALLKEVKSITVQHTQTLFSHLKNIPFQILSSSATRKACEANYILKWAFGSK